MCGGKINQRPISLLRQVDHYPYYRLQSPSGNLLEEIKHQEPDQDDISFRTSQVHLKNPTLVRSTI